MSRNQMEKSAGNKKEPINIYAEKWQQKKLQTERRNQQNNQQKKKK